MRLTRRGWFVAALVAGAIVSGALFGPRGLNAIAAPGVVALAAAFVRVARIDRPAFDRELPSRGQRGETVPVTLELAADTPFSAHVRDDVGEGLAATGNERDVAVADTELTYDLHLEARGERSVGPATVEARDVLGLIAKEFEFTTRHELLVRPRVYALAGPRRADLVTLYGGSSDDRQEFDHLRLYRRGDPVRDIHWKSSAKQPTDDLVVKTFAADESTRAVELAGEAAAGHDDAMASALASIAVDLLDEGIRVGITTPGGRLEPRGGADQRGRVLDHLARVGAGRLPEPDAERAEVRVESTADGTRVYLDDRPIPFADLAGVDVDEPAADAGVAAA